MAKKTRKGPSEEETQESLVSALESIKTLLEKSENKLSQARKSIAQANKNKPGKKKEDQDAVVPILDDVVIPGQAAKTSNDSLEFTFPDESATEDENTSTDDEPEAMDTDNVLDALDKDNKATISDYLDDLQTSLEKNLRDTLMQSVVRVEGELRKRIAEQIQIIKDKLDKD